MVQPGLSIGSVVFLWSSISAFRDGENCGRRRSPVEGRGGSPVPIRCLRRGTSRNSADHLLPFRFLFLQGFGCLFPSFFYVQVGLVIGKLSANSNRGFVYYLIPTPATDGGGPACSLKREASGNFGKDGKKGSKGAKPVSEAPASLVIDTDWVAEHARQVKMKLWLWMLGYNPPDAFLLSVGIYF